MRSSMQVSAAVAALVGASSSIALAAPPGAAAAATAPIQLYIAGSSAARPAIIGALQTNLCSGAANATTFSSSGNTNFFAISCNASTANLPSFGGALTTGANGSPPIYINTSTRATLSCNDPIPAL